MRETCEACFQCLINSQSLIGIRFNPFNVFQGKTHWFKDAKEPSQVSPTHNYLIFNTFKWIFMPSWRFTRFHTLSLECVKLVNLYEGIQASRIVSKYQALTNMWDLWRQYQQLFFGCRERTKNALTNVFICQEQFSKDEELFEKALHLFFNTSPWLSFHILKKVISMDTNSFFTRYIPSCSDKPLKTLPEMV